MRDMGKFELRHSGGIDIANPGKYGTFWAVVDTLTNDVIAEGTGNTQQDAQRRLKDSLIEQGWQETEIESLTMDEPDWVL